MSEKEDLCYSLETEQSLLTIPYDDLQLGEYDVIPITKLKALLEKYKDIPDEELFLELILNEDFRGASLSLDLVYSAK